MRGRLEGVLGPVVTPFDAAEEVDLAAFEFNLHAHLRAGLHGVLVCGSTGEAALLDDGERRRLVDAARRVVPPDRWLLVGTGAESTRRCVHRCRAAAEAGADAVLVVSPHYYANAMTSEVLEAHFERVADESPLPVLLYNIPKYAHFRLEPELVARLAEHPNIVGMKDSSGDMNGFPRYVEAQGDRFTVLTGHGGSFATALRLGARGGILAVALFAAELSLEVWHAHGDGRVADGDEAQRLLVPLAADVVARMGVPGVKAAMTRVGMRGGHVRQPLLSLSPPDAAALGILLRDARVAVPA
jgi:4-hydroxy-2-oxoglutarate aldolase